MTEERNSLQIELDELKKKFDALTPDVEAMRRADRIITEIENRRFKKEIRKENFNFEIDGKNLGLIKNPYDEVTGFENLSDEELNKELQNCKTELYPEQNLPPTEVISVEEKISAIKEKWKPVHDFDAQRLAPELTSEIQKKSNAVIRSDSMYKDGKRIASFLRSKI